MASAVEATATGSTATANTVTSGTLTPAGANTALVAVVSLYSGGGGDNLETVTWNVASPQNFTRVIGYTGAAWTTPDGRNGDTDRHVEIWYLLSPTAGTDDVTATARNSAEPAMQICVYALSGVHQTTPITLANIVENFSDSGTASCTGVTSDANGVVIDIVQTAATASPMSSDGTEVMDIASGSHAGCSSYKLGTATGMSHTLATGTAWVIIAVPFNGSSGVANTTITGFGRRLRGFIYS